MTIRRATSADRDALVRMALRFINESSYQGLIAANPAQLEALVEMLLGHQAVFVAEGGAGVVGMIGVAVNAHPMSGERMAGEIAWWVEPEYRSGIVGGRLLNAAEAWAHEQGAKVFQMIAPAGTSIGRFYVRRGYREVETTFQKAL